MFDAERWVPEYPNPAFRNRLPDDEFWMARQIVNLRDDEIRAIVETAEYSDPKAAGWVLRCLIERRNKIGRAVFAKVLPVDRFEVRDGRLVWTDVSALAGLGKPVEVQVRWAEYDNEREAATALPGETSAKLPRIGHDGYWLATLECPARPRQAVRVYMRRRGERIGVVGVERTW